MATYYITSTADSGEGTLRYLLTNKASNSIIKPSPTIFPAGTICEISLSSNIYASKNFTISGEQTRIVINGQSKYSFTINGSSSYRNTISDVDFVNCATTETGGAPIALSYYNTLNRCRVVGCSGVNCCGVKNNTGTLTDIELESCAFYGNRCTASSGAVYLALYCVSNNKRAKINGCTFGGFATRTKGTVYVHSETNYTLTSNVFPELEGEWQTPPSSSYAYSTWTKNSWVDMDPRPTSTSSFRTGSYKTGLDIEGNTRRGNGNGAYGAWEYPLSPLTFPTGLTATNITSTSARVAWNAVENASGYKIEYRPQGTSNWNAVTNS